MSVPALQLRHVTKAFGSTTAVDAVDVTLDDGELLALVGPSGCGKSTLLRLVAGLLATDDGEIRIGDDLVDDGSVAVEPERRHIGLVFQEHALFPHLTVAQNVAFGLRSLDRRERDRRRDHWLGLVGLGGHGRPLPPRAVRRRAPAGGAGPGHGAGAAADAARRAVRQPRPQPAGPDPRRRRRPAALDGHARPCSSPTTRPRPWPPATGSP